MDLLEIVNDGSRGVAGKFLRTFHCPEPDCKKTFNRPSDMKRHHRIHTGERPCVCSYDYCDSSFIQKSALTVHIRTHTGEKPHQCEYIGCAKRFSDSSSLSRHRRIHTGKRPYRCPIRGCEKSFCRKTTLMKHAKRHHLHRADSEVQHRKQCAPIPTTSMSTFYQTSSSDGPSTPHGHGDGSLPPAPSSRHASSSTASSGCLGEDQQQALHCSPRSLSSCSSVSSQSSVDYFCEAPQQQQQQRYQQQQSQASFGSPYPHSPCDLPQSLTHQQLAQPQFYHGIQYQPGPFSTAPQQAWLDRPERISATTCHASNHFDPGSTAQQYSFVAFLWADLDMRG